MMLTDQQMILLRKVSTRLRELTPYLHRTANEIDKERKDMPQRHLGTDIESDMIDAVVALDFAAVSLDDAINHIAEVTGENEAIAA